MPCKNLGTYSSSCPSINIISNGQYVSGPMLTLDRSVEKDGNPGIFSTKGWGCPPYCCPGGKMLGDVDGERGLLSPVQSDVAPIPTPGEGEEECFTPVWCLIHIWTPSLSFPFIASPPLLLLLQYYQIMGKVFVYLLSGCPTPIMSGDNRRLVTDEPVEFEREPVESWEASGGLPIVLEESMEEYASNEQSGARRCQHVTG